MPNAILNSEESFMHRLLWRTILQLPRISSVILFVLCCTLPTHAVQVIADTVTENFTPPRTENFACSTDVGITSDGSIANNGGYCPSNSVQANYEISYNFSVGLDERMDSIIVWANSGGIYSDGELRTFDMEVDYIDDAGASATLIMNGIDLGDTLSPNDPKTVLFMQAGSPVELLGVSQVRISNLAGTPSEIAFRELVGNVNQDTVNPDMIVTKTAIPSINVTAGTDVTYTYVVTNTGNQAISNISLNDIHNGFGAPPVPGDETLTADNGIPSDSSDTITNNGIWDLLAPFDEVTFTAIYTVTQADLDNLQ